MNVCAVLFAGLVVAGSPPATAAVSTSASTRPKLGRQQQNTSSGGDTIVRPRTAQQRRRRGTFDGRAACSCLRRQDNSLRTDLTSVHRGVHGSGQLVREGMFSPAQRRPGPKLTIGGGQRWRSRAATTCRNRGSDLANGPGCADRPAAHRRRHRAAGPEDVQLWGGLVLNGKHQQLPTTSV
jgi:hypothetical protein